MCKKAVQALNAELGTDFGLPIHCVQSNEKIWTYKNGKLIKNYDLPGDKIGLYDEAYETTCPPPYSIIRWDEIQKEANSRDSASMDPRVSTFTQLHRKWGIDILCFSQRLKIVDLTIRDNAVVFEIEKITHKLDKYGFIRSMTATLKYFPSLAAAETYQSTFNKSLYKITKFTFKGNPRKHYDTNEGEEHFKELALKRGLNLKFADDNPKTVEDLEERIKNKPYRPKEGYSKGEADKIRRQLNKEKEKISKKEEQVENENNN